MENKNSPQIVFYFHAGSENHGCEAIVRSTADLLDMKPILLSSNTPGDKAYGIDAITDLRNLPNINFSVLEKLRIKLTGSDKLAYYLRAGHEAESFPSCSVALSIGGDNYCYGDTYNWHLAGLNESLHKRSVKTVLWGCSIEPVSVTDDMKKDFALYDLIVARESISYSFLKEYNPNTICTCDPAFTLREERQPLPENFIEGKTVGINISPLIQKNEKIPGITYANYKKLIEFILDNTDYRIALIPHVVQDGNDDRVPLKEVYDEVKDKSRVCMIDDCNCMQLKGYISRCALFVGARTHATIAAYSSYVPTLVVGYSTKAEGIAKDLFGNEDNHILSVQEFANDTQLTESFIKLNLQRRIVKERLSSVIPSYKATVVKAVEALRMI